MIRRIRHYSQFPRAIPKKRARSHALLTRPPLGPKSSLDLHVLSLPPAFVLSQDQTLKLKRASGPKTKGNPFLTAEPLHIIQPTSRQARSNVIVCRASVPSRKQTPNKR